MNIHVKKIDKNLEEYIEIGCHVHDGRIDDIIRFVKGIGGSVSGVKDEKRYEIPVSEIFYIESVDNRTFLYTMDNCFETSVKLYEFEELLKGRCFLRISKSVVLNTMKAEAVKPALNGRFSCQLQNGESVIISRKYVRDFKEFISGRGVRA